MSTELFLDFLGVKMDSQKADGMRFTINLVTPDNGEKFVIELENATLTNVAGFLAESPDLTLRSGKLPLLPGPGLGFSLDWDAVARAKELHEKSLG